MDPGDCLSYEAGCKEIENGRTASPDDAILTAAADAERHYMEKFSEEESEVKEESPCHSAENDDESEEEEEEGDEEADSNGDLQTKEESHSSEHSPDLVIRRPPKKRKISEECLHLLEAADVLRRSGRTRKEVQRLNIGQVSDDEDEKTKRRQSSRHGKRSFKGRDSDSEDSSVSSESSGFNGVRRRQPQRKGFGRNRRKKKRAVDSSDEWSDSSSAPRRPARGGRDRIDYKESSSGGEIDSDDVLEWEEDLPSTSNLVSEVACETIEKVLKYRRGRPGAVGPSTTCYNVEEKGDPNDPPPSSIEDFEIQYLIKWVGWAHIHNTWESEETLKQASAKGMKKLENYINRVKEIEAWKKTADKDYIEYFDCEQEMNEELYEQYKQAERIIAMNRVKDKERGVEITDYFVKWLGLPYSESTWEDGGLISKRFQTVIDSFECRINSRRIPGKYSNALKKRPKFSHLKEQPYYVGKERGDRSFLLRDYQLDGLNWLLQAWCRWNSVILADEMGLGKTIQTISFLSVLIHEYEVYGPFLIVVPLSTIAAWQREFEQWDATINFIIYLGDVTSRDLIRQYEWYTLPQKRLKFNAVLTTYEILLKDKAFLGSFDWAVLMVDEAHRLKNDESLLYRALMDFRTYHRLLITGTPLQNSLKELWALLHFIMADKFDNWEAFEENHGGSDKKAYSSLHKELEPFLLRRVKKDVEKSLPAKVEQILRVDMTAIQKQYYKWILTKNYKALSKGVKGSISGFLNLMMELKKCCNHSFLVRQPDVDCTDPQERLQQIIKSSGKLILLDKLLIRLEQSGHRVLIFSQMVMLLDILQEYLRLRKFTFQRLDGSIRGDLRRQALDHFNNEGSTDFCFLLSTKAGGLGINLATADTVIIFDSDWNPQNDLQAQSRAHRIGQTRQVNIYRLVTKGSVEEDIVERAKKKLVLDHLVIQRMDTTGRTVLSKNAVTSAGSIHFDKQELAAILKFGAEDLFKEKEGEEQEPEVDIDDILQRAETREMDSQTSCGDELLGAFKYANFAFDEAEEIEMMPQTKNQGQVLEEKEWDEIIPEEERRKLEEEQRLQMEMELQLPPRQRNKIQQMARNEDSDEDWEKSRKKRKKGDDSESSESSDEERPSRIKRARKALLFSFSESEIRKFIKAFKKFAQPMSRLEAIACDAELEEHSSGELKQVAEALIRGCKQAVEEYAQQQKPQGEPDSKKRDRGPVCKLGPVEVAVRPLLRIQSDLEPLYCIMPGTAHERKHFVLPSKPKVLKNWDCEWDENDDAALLRGIYEYGMGSWDSIKMDPDLGLNEKIMLSDKNKKPQAKHIQSRADYLLKFLQKQKDQTGEDAYYRPKEDLDELINSVINNTLDSKETKVKKDKQETTGKKDKVLGEEKKKKEKAKVGESKKREVEEGELEGEKGTVVSSKKESKPKKTEKPLVTAKTDHLGVKNRYANDLADQNSLVFKECVQLMGPASRSMKRMSKSESEEDRNHYLLKVGDHIQECLVSKVKDEKVLEKWLSYLWIFVARFTTELDAAKWHRRYRDISHNRNKEREQESKEHRHENKEYKHHDHHHRQRHHHHKHNEKQASSTCQLHVPQLTDKQHHQTHHTKYHHHSQPSTSTARYGRTEEKFFTRNSDQIHATQEFQPKQLGDSGSPVVSRFPSENPAWHHSRYEEPRYMQRRTEKSYNDLPNPNFHQRGSHFQDFKRDTSSSNRRSGYGGYNNFPVR